MGATESRDADLKFIFIWLNIFLRSSRCGLFPVIPFGFPRFPAVCGAQLLLSSKLEDGFHPRARAPPRVGLAPESDLWPK